MTEFSALKKLSARVGADPLLVQAAGGNTSLKQNGVMWIKASGTWLREAASREIFVPIHHKALLAALARNDPACETCTDFVVPDLNATGLRPSIETTVHALMPQRVVVHVHCVNTIAWAIRGDAEQRLAEKLKGFNCKILAYDKYKTNFDNEFVIESSLDEIKNNADVLSLHIPLTGETTFLVDEQFINSFAKPFYLINTARGKCVFIHDLVSGLKSGKVIGACLDVYEYEDTSFEKFSIESAGLLSNPDWKYLTSSDQVILSPHIAGWTVESLRKIAEVLVSKIRMLD